MEHPNPYTQARLIDDIPKDQECGFQRSAMIYQQEAERSIVHNAMHAQVTRVNQT